MDGDKSIPVTLCPSSASAILNDPVPQPISKMVTLVCGSQVSSNLIQVPRTTGSRKPWSGSLSNVDAKSSQYCRDSCNRFSLFSLLRLFMAPGSAFLNEMPNGSRYVPSGVLVGRIGQHYYIPLFSPQEFIRRRLLEKRNPWLHHLGRYVE